MSQHLSKKQFFSVALMLFAMFFGAGNFIFPPMLGQSAGKNLYEAILFFGLTAVALPILGIAAVAKIGSLEGITKRVSFKFSIIFTFVIYIVIGPLFGIPRAATTPFEVVLAPFISKDYHSIWLLVYTFVYFLINYIICVNPSKLVDAIGGILTPIMLILILVLFAWAIIFPMGDLALPKGDYINYPATSGFLEGYQTMDALASLVFAGVVVKSMKSLGIKDNRLLVSSTIKAGVLSGALLMCVYLMLSYIGATSVNIFDNVKNGAELLSLITNHLFGKAGNFVLGAIFLLACFTTTVGLLTSIAEFFSDFSKKFSYKQWLIIWSVISFLIANIGLEMIIKSSIPILKIIYPVAIVIILLALVSNFIESSKLIYRSCIYLTLIISLFSTLDGYGLKFGFLRFLPFYEIGLGWVTPLVVCFAVTYVIFLITKKDSF